MQITLSVQRRSCAPSQLLKRKRGAGEGDHENDGAPARVSKAGGYGCLAARALDYRVHQ